MPRVRDVSSSYISAHTKRYLGVYSQKIRKNWEENGVKRELRGSIYGKKGTRASYETQRTENWWQKFAKFSASGRPCRVLEVRLP